MPSFWDVYATVYDALPRFLPSYGRTMALVCDFVADHTTQSGLVLDAGCGTGNYTTALAQRGCSVVGVDGSPSMLRRAQRKAAGLPIRLVHADLESRLPLPDSSTDAIVSVMVLYALSEPQSFLAELRRVARTGAVLALVTTDDRDLLAPSVREVVRERGLLAAAPALAALVGVGAVNAVINARFGRGYTAHTDAGLTKLLEGAGWGVVSTTRCYVDGAGVLVAAVAK